MQEQIVTVKQFQFVHMVKLSMFGTVAIRISGSTSIYVLLGIILV